MSRGPDAATLLVRALNRAASSAGLTLAVRSSDWQRWASATFAGARHELLLELPDIEAAARWLAALPEADIPIRGHLVADAIVLRTHGEGDMLVVAIEVLTVEDG
ncbi:hypothetical protein [Sphingomonas sp. AX6]|uniref:hypothetical protein n=1 Tax=Sphingomonas sp. AX6 TaxID=2653171 RepID=UPI0012F1E239|nr:hypothetical protein [Sphingomonas sp. AX6]VXC42458.1 conserved hypothetical protein [Sphingomonas sp. AX6]